MMDFINKHQKIFIIVMVVVAVLILLTGGVANMKSRKAKEQAASSDSTSINDNESNDGENTDTTEAGMDEDLMKKQDDFTERWGEAPEGYIWDYDGSLISLGDKSMSAEDVVYAYFNGLRLLDFSTVQKYSRGSKVYSRYNDYFDAKQASSMSYSDNFQRNMYRLALTSIKVNGIESNALFTNNKQTFTVSINMLDLSYKDFWQKDKDTIYRNLMDYGTNQGDTTKSDQYLYDYILSYYKRPDAKKRDVTVDVTVQKYPAFNSGWLVSIDTDVDNACNYTDGTSVLSNIKESYNDEKYDYFDDDDDEDADVDEDDE